MFEIRQWRSGNNYCVAETISAGEWNYLHSNGKIYHCAAEYWPTKEEAQAVLDKFQPKHISKHGDVFESARGIKMIYMHYYSNRPAQAIGLIEPVAGPALDMDSCMDGAEFLFNIREKI